jgi:hypothetical protein
MGIEKNSQMALLPSFQFLRGQWLEKLRPNCQFSPEHSRLAVSPRADNRNQTNNRLRSPRDYDFSPWQAISISRDRLVLALWMVIVVMLATLLANYIS